MRSSIVIADTTPTKIITHKPRVGEGGRSVPYTSVTFKFDDFADGVEFVESSYGCGYYYDITVKICAQKCQVGLSEAKNGAIRGQERGHPRQTGPAII